jgi:hypothetical protein
VRFPDANGLEVAPMLNGLSLSTRLQIPEGVVHRELEGELVVLNLHTGVYFGLDPVGTRIWQLLQEHQVLQLVLDRLLEEYEVAEAQVRDDLLKFVALGLEKGLFELHSGTTA